MNKKVKYGMKNGRKNWNIIKINHPMGIFQVIN